MADQICIVGGTGALGFGLALRFAAAGVPVVIGSRAAGRAADAAARIVERVPDADVRGAENPDAVAGCPIVILTVPFQSHAETLTGLTDALGDDQLVVDATVPLASEIGGKPTRTIGVWQGSAAAQARELVPDGVRVVSAFHTVNAAQLADLEVTLDEDVLVCGDRRADKEPLMELVRRVDGLRPVNAGALETSAIVEQLTALLISINIRHKARAGIRITGLGE